MNNMSENIRNEPIKPIHKPKRKSRRIEKGYRFRSIGNRILYEFVLPKGARIVNGLVFQDLDGRVNCLGTIHEFIGGISK